MTLLAPFFVVSERGDSTLHLSETAARPVAAVDGVHCGVGSIRMNDWPSRLA